MRTKALKINHDSFIKFMRLSNFSECEKLLQEEGEWEYFDSEEEYFKSIGIPMPSDEDYEKAIC